MSTSHARIQDELTRLALEFSRAENHQHQMSGKPKKANPKKQEAKPEKQEDSFENFQKNMSQSLINHARRWKDTSSHSKKAKSKTSLASILLMMQHGLGENMQAQSEMAGEQEGHISCPTKPLGPYMLFHIEKSSEQKQKKLIAIAQSKSSQKNVDSELFKQKMSDSVSIYEQWNSMSMQEKDRFYLQYENRLRKYNMLNDEFIILTNRKRILKPYNRFYRKIYGLLEVEGKHSLPEITRMIKQQWAALGEQDKKEYEQQYQEEKQELDQIQKTKHERIKVYKEKLAQYEMQEHSQKLQILAKFNLAPKELDEIAKLAEDQRILKTYEKKQERQRKKERSEKAKKAILQQNYRRILQLRQKQILELKLQNYEIQGIPRDIFMATPLKIAAKVSSSSTTLAKQKKQSDSDDDLLRIEVGSLEKTKRIKKQVEPQEKEKLPGVSTFRKLLMEKRTEDNPQQ